LADTIEASYEQLAQDVMDGKLPVAKDICQYCTAFGVPFSVNGDGGPRQGDKVLGIPSLPESATDAWLLNNRWIKDKTQNIRDTFLLRVIQQLGADHGDAYLAELYAFAASQRLEFCCLDDEIADDALSPAILGEFATRSNGAHSFVLDKNFRFYDHKIYFATFTRAEYADAPWREELDDDGNPVRRGPFTWKSVDGLYAVPLAAKQLAQEFDAAKHRQRISEAIKGAFEVATGVLAFIPAVGEVEMGAVGAYKVVRYTVAAIDAALAANAMVDGSSRVITGEGLDVGEKLFERIGALANPKDGAERGRQVFMVINLAMLSPAAFGGARWVLRKFSRNGDAIAHLDISKLTEAERKSLQGKQTAQVEAIELRLEKRTASNAAEGKVTVSELPSLDTNQSLVSVATQSGKANYAVMSRTLRDRMVLMITHHVGSVKAVGRMGKVVGDAGEEVLAATMVERWGFRADKILGYSSAPAVASRFGLANRSGHGLDMLVRVPPPPSITVRVPTTDAMRNHIDGLKGTAPTKTITFTEDTLLVIETKSTLGGVKTSKFNISQGVGATKVKDVMDLIRTNKGHWKRSNILSIDPDAMTKVSAINAAIQTRKIQYLHAQIFFDHRGQLNSVVGGGTGIQLNTW
jgi:hypothetical protein